MDLTEKKISSETVFEGRIITVTRDAVSLPNNNSSIREVVHSADAAVILPVFEDGRILLVRQYRYTHSRVMLEAVAGKLNKGEDPLSAAIRELREETGLSAGRMESLGVICATPGFCTERLHLFLARDLSQGETNFDEDEFIVTQKYSMEKLRSMILGNEIEDAKTIAIYMKAEAALNGQNA